MKKKKVNFSILSLFLVAIIWGSGFVASSNALDHNSTNVIMVLRFSIAALGMFIVKPSMIKQLNRKLVKDAFILGIFIYSAFFFQTLGLEHTTASKNAFITSTNILIVPIIAFLIEKRKMKRTEMLGLAVAAIGLLLISYEGSIGMMNKGDIITLVSAVFFALQIYFTGRFVIRYNEEELIALTFAQMLTSAIISLFPAMIQGTRINYSLEAIRPVLYLGLVSTLLAYYLQTKAQKCVDQVKTALILSTEAIFGAVFSVLLLNERLSMNTILGSLLIFVAIVVVEYTTKDD